MELKNIFKKFNWKTKNKPELVNVAFEEIKAISLKMPEKETKILLIADTHGLFEYPCDITLLDVSYRSDSCDAAFLLGDISITELNSIRNYFKCPLYMITGNHDSKEVPALVDIFDLNGNIVSINGLDFVGWSGSIKYKNSDRSMMTDEESISFAKALPHADILISHDIPKRDTKDLAHSGLKGIAMYLEEHQIALHIHGHLHRQEDIIRENGTRSIGVFSFAEMVIDKNAVVTIRNL